MSKDNLYVEVIGGSLDDKGRERLIANIYNHRGDSVCDQVWQEDAEEVARRWNAHDGLVEALRAIVVMASVCDPSSTLSEDMASTARAALAKAENQQ